MNTNEYREFQDLKHKMLVQTHKLEQVEAYLRSKVDIGLIKVVLIQCDGNGFPYLLVNGVSLKMWEEVFEPEVRRLVNVKSVHSGEGWVDLRGDSNYEEISTFVRVWLKEVK